MHVFVTARQVLGMYSCTQLFILEHEVVAGDGNLGCFIVIYAAAMVALFSGALIRGLCTPLF